MQPVNRHAPCTRVDAERAVIGTIILTQRPSTDWGLQSEHFYLGIHQQLVKALNRVISKTKGPADYVTIHHELTERGVFPHASNIAHLIDMVDELPHGQHGDYWSEIVRSSFIRRSIQYGLNDLQKLVASGEFDVAQWFRQTEALVQQIASEQQIRPVRATDLIRDNPHLRKPIVDGLLRQGETMNLVSATKVGKSWLAINMAICMVTGRTWLDKFSCRPAKVLHIDTELHEETLADRINTVLVGMNVGSDEIDNYFTFPVRGKNWDLNDLPSVIRSEKPDVIMLDALYRVVPADRDENSNREMAQIYNSIDAAADRDKVGVVLVHHSSKGSQAGKHNTDIGSGAGSMSRAVDTHATMVRIDEEGYEDHFKFTASLRSFPGFEPLVLRREHPLWVLTDRQVPAESDTAPIYNRRKKKQMHGESVASRLLGEVSDQIPSVLDNVDVIKRVIRSHDGVASKSQISGDWIEMSDGIPLPTKGSLSRILSHAVKMGDLAKTGSGSQVRYKLPGHQTYF
jgi:hypothetical protein